MTWRKLREKRNRFPFLDQMVRIDEPTPEQLKDWYRQRVKVIDVETLKPEHLALKMEHNIIRSKWELLTNEVWIRVVYKKQGESEFSIALTGKDTECLRTMGELLSDIKAYRPDAQIHCVVVHSHLFDGREILTERFTIYEVIPRIFTP